MSILLAILTDGPRLGDVTIAEIQATNAARDHAVMVQGVLAMAAVVLLIGAALVLPRLWRRVLPPTSGASGSNG